MRIPGFRDRTDTTTTTRVDPVSGDTVRVVDHDSARVHETRNVSAGAAGPTGTYAAAGGITLKELQQETHEAYKRGKRDERSERVSHPILTILVVLLAILGLVLGVLALRERSFEGAGAIFDRWVGLAAIEAREAGVQVQDAAGEAAQDTGAALQSTGESVERDAEAARP